MDKPHVNRKEAYMCLASHDKVIQLPKKVGHLLASAKAKFISIQYLWLYA